MLEEDLLALLSRKARIGASQEDHTYLPEVIKVLDKLPPDQKRAVVLRRIIGHTEEQAAKICKVDKRTIRYRLARADTQLKKLKEDL
jgi:DNA-directed RNA polymerase specialized sigma24 family protein